MLLELPICVWLLGFQWIMENLPVSTPSKKSHSPTSEAITCSSVQSRASTPPQFMLPFCPVWSCTHLGQVARATLKSWAQWLCHVQKTVSHCISPVTGSFVLSASSVIFSQSWSGEGQKQCPIYFWTVNLLLSPLWPDRHPCIHCCPWQKVASLAKVESNPGWDLILIHTRRVL